MIRRLTQWLALCLIILLPVTAAHLQGGVCPPLVERALNEAGNLCATLPRNSACYGFNQVSAQFSGAVAEDFFTRPADITDLTTLQSLNTAALDEALGRWGVAVLNVQANIPNSLPGQGVRFILFGDARLENAVPAEQALLPVTPVEVTVVSSANLRSGPSTNTNVLGGAEAGSTFPAEGLNPAGDWVRVNTPQVGLAWIARDLLNPAGDLASLPVITEESRSPMQAFQFRTGLGQISCDQAPSALMVQGPQGFKVQIEANGATIELGSTILLRASDDRMQLTTLEGEAEIGDLIIPAGYSSEAPLDESGEAGEFEVPERAAEEDLLDLQWLDEVPDDLLEYDLDVPTFDEVDELSPEDPLATEEAQPGGDDDATDDNSNDNGTAGDDDGAGSEEGGDDGG
jgi:hypothetical protein